jgi:hypothetical protein
MRIADLFGGNQNIAAISSYCSKRGTIMPEREQEHILKMLEAGERFFVFISADGVECRKMRERSALLGRIVSYRFKRETVLFFHDGAYREVTRANWSETRRMIEPKQPTFVDDRIRVPKRERTAFDDALPGRPNKKAGRKGFLRTLTANESMSRLSMTLA